MQEVSDALQKSDPPVADPNKTIEQPEVPANQMPPIFAAQTAPDGGWSKASQSP